MLIYLTKGKSFDMIRGGGDEDIEGGLRHLKGRLRKIVGLGGGGGGGS